MQQEQEKARAGSLRPYGYAVLLPNQKSGSFSKDARLVDEAVSFLRERGWRVDVQTTGSSEDARKVTRNAVAQQADMVVAIGGDGTIHSIIQELAGSETVLGVLPSGTFNVWAQETGIPLDTAGALDVLVNGQTRRIDLGYMNDRYFLLMTGIGFGGKVTYTVKKESMKRLGILGYLLVGLRLAFGFQSFRATLKIDGQQENLRALHIVVGNTKLYGSVIKFTWKARCDDGVLDVCVVRQPGKSKRLAVMLDFLLHRGRARKWVSYRTCHSVEIHTRKPVAIQCDGEPIGYTPATIRVVPRALSVVVPQNPPENVFSDQSEEKKQ